MNLSIKYTPLPQVGPDRVVEPQALSSVPLQPPRGLTNPGAEGRFSSYCSWKGLAGMA